jgi:DNA-binding YbaB/EbfC family protein
MNFAKMMKQAQEMQSGMLAKQEQLAQNTFEATVGGGKVKVLANGNGDVTAISIDPELVDPEDVEFLEQLVLQGVQEAVGKGKAAMAEEMKKLTGGLGGLPGMPGM